MSIIFFLILFFVSLLGIIFMIVFKLASIDHSLERNAQSENFIAEIFDFQKIKRVTIKNLKKDGHALVWLTLRTYLISFNFLKKKKEEILQKIKEKINTYKKKGGEEETENKEPSKYLNLISEYRQKIKHIKHRIKEEEGIE